MSSSGQLILLDGEDGKPVIYRPVNNIIQVGSEKTANVCLSGLKSIAFTIYIDNLGRVCINNCMKRVQINGKRIAKNVTRTLVNNSTIEIANYKFTWKYNSKFSKSYSMSPSKKSTQDVEMVIRNRKTISSFAVSKINDENSTSAVEQFCSTTVEPVNVQTSDETLDKSSMNAAKKRASIIPVKSNRTSELRRASIARSKSVGDDLKPIQFVTPKKPIINTAMAKSVNAIIRSESSEHAKFGNRKSLGSNLPTIIDNMNLFNVVTDEMKAAGPGAYILKKFGVTNSPKRTPKKVVVKPKRLSLRSELSEMGILKTKVSDMVTPIKDEEQAEIAPINKTEAETETETVNPDTAEARTELSSTLTSMPSVEIIEDSTEYSDDSDSSDSVFSIISVDDSDVDEINESLHLTENENSPQILADAIVDDDNVVSDKSIVTEGSADLKVDDDNVVSDKSIVKDEIEEIKQVEEQQEQALTNESPENVAEVSESQLSTVSTPTKRQSNIRSRRNSQLCSLYECCSPSAFVTPSKKKLANDRVSTPRSILKTPKASKTLKKTVRIMETILHEEEDDVVMANGEPSEALISNETSDQLQSETGTLNVNDVTNSQSDSDSNKNNASECGFVIKSIDVSLSDDLFNPGKLEIILSQSSVDKQQMSDEVIDETVNVNAGDLNVSESDEVIDETVNVNAGDLNVSDDVFTPEIQTLDGVVVETATVADDENVTGDVLEPETPQISNVVSIVDAESEITEPKSTDEIPTSDDVVTETETVANVEIVTDDVFTTETPVISDADAESENGLPSGVMQTSDNSPKVSTEDIVREIKEEKDEGNSSLPNEREETNMFDVTFEIESNGENEQDDTPVQSTSHVDENNDLSDVRGVKELLNTPKTLDKTNLIGMKELLQTPSNGSDWNDVRGVKELLNTPKPLDKTNLVGMKELLNTPTDGNDLDDVRGVKELLNTPKPLDKTNLIGMKELLNTPTDANDLSYAWGVKELLNTPKPHDKTNLVGMKELLQTPNVCNQSIDMRGFKELLKTPKSLNRTNFVGIKELLETPVKQEENQPEGIADDAPNADSDAQNQTANSSADADKRFHLSLKFNTRDSLVRLVNNTLTNIGLTPIPEIVQPPQPEVTQPVATQPVATQPEATQPEQNSQSSTDETVPKTQDEPISEKSTVDTAVNASETQAESAASESELELEADPQSSDKEQKVEACNGSSNSEVTDATHSEQPKEKSKVHKTPRMTRKEAEATQSSTVSSTRTRRAIAVAATESNDENISETSQASETPSVDTKVGRKRTRKATVTETSQIPEPSQPKPLNDQLNVPKTRKRLASGVTSTESNDEDISEVSQASETPSVDTKVGRKRTRKATVTETSQIPEPSQSKPQNDQVNVRKTRKRRASGVKSTEPNDEEISEVSQASETPNVDTKVGRKRTRKATVTETSEASAPTQSEPVNDEVNVPKTRKRRVSVVTPTESNDEEISEVSQASETPSVDTKVGRKRTRKATVTETSEASEPVNDEVNVPKTRKRRVSVVTPTESNDENASENSQASETPSVKKVGKNRKRKATVAEKSQASEPIQSEPNKAEVKVSKSRKRRASGVTPTESNDENVSENSQTSESTQSKVTRARKDPVVQDAPTKVTRSTRSAKNVESVPATENLPKPPAKRRRKMTEVDPTETPEPSPVKQSKKVTAKTKPTNTSDDEVIASSSKVSHSTKRSKAAMNTKNRKRSESISEESTASTATRSSKRGKTNTVPSAVEEIPAAANKRPKRGKK